MVLGPPVAARAALAHVLARSIAALFITLLINKAQLQEAAARLATASYPRMTIDPLRCSIMLHTYHWAIAIEDIAIELPYTVLALPDDHVLALIE